MTNDRDLYQKAFELLEKHKNEILKRVKSFGEFRSQVSGLSVGMIICNPLDYYETDKESKRSVQNVKQEERCTSEIILDFVKELMKEDGRDDLLKYLDKKDNSNKAQLVFKKDGQKYFTILKNTINLEKIERQSNG